MEVSAWLTFSWAKKSCPSPQGPCEYVAGIVSDDVVHAVTIERPRLGARRSAAEVLVLQANHDSLMYMAVGDLALVPMNICLSWLS